MSHRFGRRTGWIAPWRSLWRVICWPCRWSRVDDGSLASSSAPTFRVLIYDTFREEARRTTGFRIRFKALFFLFFFAELLSLFLPGRQSQMGAQLCLCLHQPLG